MRWCVLALTVLVYIAVARAQKTEELRSNVCVEQKTCGACVAAGGQCGWCMQGEEFDKENKVRCDVVESLIENGCDMAFVVFPAHKIDLVRNLDVRNAIEGQDAVQIQPQEVKIRLRPNQPFKLDIAYRQAENYPVDLYYVMDLSHSMGDDKQKLAELGDLLAEKMSAITKNFRLGFGSFVDKKTMPYVSTVPSKLIQPCTDCAAPYGFKNQLRLTDDTSQFRTEVLRAPISGNLDGPEGGFDAIMQAIACKNEIGWREASRKIMLFSSDAGFHYAGDGKLGGIVTPNDGHCHLDAQGYYSESLNQDYPSISQLSHKITNEKVNIIFAITENQFNVYDKLKDYIEGSTVGILADDSANVVDLVKNNYEKISSTVELKTEGAEDISVQFKTKCFGNETRNSAKCDGLGIGHNVSFEAYIEVQSCPKDKTKWKRTFDIYPVGLTEKLTIELDLICECDCEAAEIDETNSPSCNKSGTLECGACTCNEGMYGKHCECDGSSLGTDDYEASCKMSNTSEVCDGKGECLCGECDCYAISPGDMSKTYSGPFCQCNDYSCDYHMNKPCGGPGRGVCQCGQCKCNPAYKGKACACPVSDEPCRAKSSGLICNGKGTCNCGVCDCSRDGSFAGPTCEDCETCPGKCEQNKACVQCKAHKSGPLSKEYCEENCTFVEVQNSVEESTERKPCQFIGDDGCKFFFSYEYNSNIVIAQRTKECPEPVDILAIILGVVGGIVAVGLALLLIWKLLMTIHDRREFAKFEKERQNAKWDTGENPIYKQATSTFKNPMYGGK